MKIESTKEANDDKKTTLYLVRMNKREMRYIYDLAHEALIKCPKHTLEFKMAKVMLKNICRTLGKVISQPKK